MGSRKYKVLTNALARKYGVDVGDSISLDPDDMRDKVAGRLRLNMIRPAVKGKKKSKKVETAEAPVETE